MLKGLVYTGSVFLIAVSLLLTLSSFTNDMHIITEQSYPLVGDNWTVAFNTTGRADLVIRTAGKTTWGSYDSDLRFLELRCGNKTMEYEWYNSSVIVRNYYCEETSYETSKVLTAGRHSIEINFGDKKNYAKNDADMFETGIVDTNGWTHVNTKRTYSYPIVVAIPREGFETSADHEVATAVIRNVTSSSFEVQIYNETNGALAGNVSYIVVENGTHTLSNGMLLQAGKIVGVDQYNANGVGGTSYRTVTFWLPYSSNPIVIASPNNDSAQDWVSTRWYTGTLSTAGIDISLEIDNSYGTGPIAASTVGSMQTNSIAWIAINSTSAMDMEAGILPNIAPDPQDGPDAWATLNFSNTYTEPLFFAMLEEGGGTDPCRVGVQDLTTNDVDVRLTEERTDNEQDHNDAEDALWMVFESNLGNTMPKVENPQFDSALIDIGESVVFTVNVTDDDGNDTIAWVNATFMYPNGTMVNKSLSLYYGTEPAIATGDLETGTIAKIAESAGCINTGSCDTCGNSSSCGNCTGANCTFTESYNLSTNLHAESHELDLSTSESSDIQTLTNTYNMSKAFIITQTQHYDGADVAGTNPRLKHATVEWSGCSGELCNQVTVTRGTSGRAARTGINIIQSDAVDVYNFTVDIAATGTSGTVDISSWDKKPADPTKNCFIQASGNVRVTDTQTSADCNNPIKVEYYFSDADTVTASRPDYDGDGGCTGVALRGVGYVVCFNDGTNVTAVDADDESWETTGGEHYLPIGYTLSDLSQAFVTCTWTSDNEDGIEAANLWYRIYNTTHIGVAKSQYTTPTTTGTSDLTCYVIDFTIGNSTNAKVENYYYMNSATVGDATAWTATINETDSNKTTMIAAWSFDNGEGTAHARGEFAYSFQDNITIQFKRGQTGNTVPSHDVNVQIITFPNATVSEGGCSGSLDCSAYITENDCDNCSQCYWKPDDTEANTSNTTYYNIDSNLTDKITRINVTVTVTTYVSTGSDISGNNDPDLRLFLYNGAEWVDAGAFSFTGTGTKTISVTEDSVLNAWENTANRNILIRGIYFDYNIGPDEIDWDTVTVDIEYGNKTTAWKYTWTDTLTEGVYNVTDVYASDNITINHSTYDDIFFEVSNLNTEPNVTTPVIYPSSPDESSELNCSTIPTDNRSALLNVTFRWYVNGAYQSDYTTTVENAINNTQTYTNLTVPSSALNPWDNWTCEVFAYDGNLYSVYMNSTPVQVSDTTPPLVTVLSAVPDPVEIYNFINISATVTDYTDVDKVLIEIEQPDSTRTNYTTAKAGDIYYNDTINSTQLGSHTYRIYANDTEGSLNNTESGTFDVEDTTEPLVTNLLAIPDPVEVYNFINISFNATDNIDIDNALLEIEYPDTSRINYTVFRAPKPGFVTSEHVIDTGTNVMEIHDIEYIDFDRDGDYDVLAVAFASDEINWWENQGDNLTFTNHLILDNFNTDGVRDLEVIDFDNDGYYDIVYASGNEDRIAWLENTGDNLSFTDNEIVESSADCDNPWDIEVMDFDNDNDYDVVAALYDDDEVSWWENDGTNTSFTKNIVERGYLNLDMVSDIEVIDFDKDSDYDIAYAATNEDRIAWFENTGDNLTFNDIEVIESSVVCEDVRDIEVMDFDNDNDYDIVSAVYTDDRVAWWENDGTNTTFVERLIASSSDVDGANDVELIDFDYDGDYDIFVTSYDANKTALWKNDGSNLSFDEYIITSGTATAGGAWKSRIVDFEGDGEYDIILAAYDAYRLAWWEINTTVPGNVFYNDTINTTQLGSHTYRIYANDTEGNLNNTESGTFDVEDTTNPSVTNLQAPGTLELGDYINISADVEDNFAVDLVLIELEYPDSSRINYTTVIGSSYYNDTISPGQLGTYTYRIYANDSSGNLNNTEYSTFSVEDTTPPSVTGLSEIPDPVNVSGYINISSLITDLSGVDIVIIEVEFPDSSRYNYTTLISGNTYYNDTVNATQLGEYTYIIYANDSLGNLNNTESSLFNALEEEDTEKPKVTSLQENPDPVELGNYIDISLNVTDNVEVGYVIIEIEYPDSSRENFTAISETQDIYHNGTINSTQLGSHTYRIYANDTSGNLNDTGSGTFSVEDTTSPSVTSLQANPDPAEIYNFINLSATVTDSGTIDKVLIEVEEPDITRTNYTTAKAGDVFYNDTINTTHLGSHTYRIYTNDTVGNLNNTEYSTFAVEDTTPPLVTSLQAIPDPVEVYNFINISFNVTDNYQLENVTIEIEEPDSTRINYTAVQIDDVFYNDTINTTQLGTHTYRIYANDTESNLNDTESGTFDVEDTTEPLVTNLQAPATLELGDYINISADVEDNFAVDTVLIELEYPDSSRINYTTIQGSSYYNDTIGPGQLGTYTYRIYANDTESNLNDTESGTFDVEDTTPPLVTSLQATPDPVEIYSFINISVTATDYTDVDKVLIEIEQPDSTRTNYTTAKAGDIYYNDTINSTQLGSHTYRIYANDTIGNLNDTESSTFDAEDMTNPEVTNLLALPDPVEVYNFINISLIAMDNYDIDKVLIEVEETDSTRTNYTTIKSNIVYYNDTINATQVGLHTYRIYANDTSGNLNDTESSTFYAQETGLPVIDFVPPTDGNNSAVQRNYTYVNVTVIDSISNIGSCLLEWDSSNESMNKVGYGMNVHCEINKSAVDGVHSYKIWANDTEGNTNSTDTMYIILDTIPPEFIVESPVNQTYNATASEINITLNYLVYDTISSADQCWYSIDDNDNITLQNCQNTTFLASIGLHSLNLYSNDTLNNINITQINFTYKALGYLNATLINPLPDSSNMVAQNSTFTIIANVTCQGVTGVVCDDVSGIARYNASGNTKGNKVVGEWGIMTDMPAKEGVWSEEWMWISFEHEFDEAPVVIHDIDLNSYDYDDNPAYTRITGVNTTGFFVRVESWDDRNTTNNSPLPNATIDGYWLAMEKGIHNITDKDGAYSRLVEVSNFTMLASECTARSDYDRAGNNRNFQYSWTYMPMVLARVQTANDDDEIAQSPLHHCSSGIGVAYDNTCVQVGLTGLEPDAPGNYVCAAHTADEEGGYIAWEMDSDHSITAEARYTGQTGNSTISYQWEAIWEEDEGTSCGLSNDPYPLDSAVLIAHLSQNWTEGVAFATGVRIDGGDGFLAVVALSNSDIIHYAGMEDQNGDSDTSHISEPFAFLFFNSSSGFLYNNETGMQPISTSVTTPLYTNDAQPQYCNSLGQNQSCQLNWTVNATGNLDTSWLIDVMFSGISDLIDDSYTENSAINITAVGYLEVNLTEPPDSTSVMVNRTFRINATVTCRNGPCSTVSGTARYNYSTANPDTPINTTPGDYPLFTDENPKSCGYLAEDESCTLEWMVNATGDLGSYFEIDVNFTGIESNDTDDSTINIVCFYVMTLQWDFINFSSLYPGDYIDAVGNDDMLYNITVDEDSCAIDLYIKGINLTKPGTSYVIGVGNVTWNTTNQYPGFELNYTYALINSSVPSNTNITTYYWIDAPITEYGDYNGTIWISGVEPGENP